MQHAGLFLAEESCRHRKRRLTQGELGEAAKKMVAMRKSIILGLVSLVACALLWTFAERLGGRRPAADMREALSMAGPASDAALYNLRASTAARPDDKDTWQVLADALSVRVNASENPPPGLVLEIIDVLHEILRIDPQDKFALLKMADVSADHQVFSKAVTFYEKYLMLAPDDKAARIRYASALTFNSAAEKAIQELDKVLSLEPQNFHALAYAAIAYRQLGDNEKARRSGESALRVAPNDEVRQRFKGFVESLPLP